MAELGMILHVVAMLPLKRPGRPAGVEWEGLLRLVVMWKLE